MGARSKDWTNQHNSPIIGAVLHQGRKSMTSRVTYSDDIADRICDELSQGVSMRTICAAPDMPNRRTVMRWMDDNAEFAAKCARAREIGLDDRAEEMRERIEVEEDVQRARLIFDYGRWYLSKLAPKKYGDRAALELSGPDGGPVQVLDVTKLSDAALAEIVAAGNGEADACAGTRNAAEMGMGA